MVKEQISTKLITGIHFRHIFGLWVGAMLKNMLFDGLTLVI